MRATRLALLPLVFLVTAFACGNESQLAVPTAPPTDGGTSDSDPAGDAASSSTEHGFAALQVFGVTATTGATTDPLLDLARDLEATIVRPTPNIGWYNVERTLGGGYFWDRHDEVVRLMQSYGMEYVAPLMPQRPDDPGAPKCLPPSGPQRAQTMFLISAALQPAYQAWVRALVERYDGDGIDDMPGLDPKKAIKKWSFTAEAGTGWCSDTQGGVVDEMIPMFKLTYDAIKAADPDAVVILPLGPDGVYLATFADGYMPDRASISFKGKTVTRADAASQPLSLIVANVKKLVTQAVPDIYDIHLYGDPAAIGARRQWLAATTGATLRREPTPTIAMEGGEPYAPVGEQFPQGPTTCPATGSVVEDAARLEVQSSAMVKHFVLAFENRYDIVTFNLVSEYAAFGAWFGDLDLLDACGKQRPAYYTFRLAAQRLTRFANATEVGGTPAGVHLHRFTFASRADVWLAWDDGAPSGTTTPRDLSSLLGFDAATLTHPVTVVSQVNPRVDAGVATNAIPIGAVPVFIARP